MKKILAVLLIVCFTSVGCTGSFNLTKKVYNMHRSNQPDKWADELTFLVCVLIPVYGIATFADAIVFNSIEFWTGENPVALNNADSNKKIVSDEQRTAEISYNEENGQIKMTPQGPAAENTPIILEKTDSMVMSKDENGNVVYFSVKKDEGDVAVYDKDLNLVKSFSANEVKEIKEKYLK